MATTIQEDLDLAKAALRRIAGADPATYIPEPGATPGIVKAFKATKAEANKALDSLFEREYDRQAEEAEKPA